MTVSTSRVIQAVRGWDPAAGKVVVRAQHPEPGYWAGCPGVLVDGERILVTYRRRSPRGAQPERGWGVEIGELRDGVVSPLVQLHKDELASPSLERSCLRRTQAGYEWYVSYVDPADNRWRIDVLQARRIEDLVPDNRQPVLLAKDCATPGLDIQGVKDPWLLPTATGEALVVSVALGRADATAAAHATADIYNTPHARSASGIAFASEPDAAGPVPAWTWGGIVMDPADSGPHAWDSWCARLTGAVVTQGGYLGFYDGESDVARNYEEHVALASSPDAAAWTRLDPSRPAAPSGMGTGSVRYVTPYWYDGQLHLLYEMTQMDGSHDLALATLPGVQP